jgi:hypothetical protein
LVQMLGEIFSLAILETEIDEIRGLKCEIETIDERVPDLFQDIDLSNHELRLLAQYDLFLLKYFEGVKPVVLQTRDQKNLAKGSLP